MSIFDVVLAPLSIQFLSPHHLWGLFLIGVPILIHLYSIRNFKKVVISNVEFLKKIENSGIARKKLKEILVLLSRAFAVFFLVIAFSEPVITDGSGAEKLNSLVKIHIDNSFSMGLKKDGVDLLTQAKLVAESIIEHYDVNDRFQIHTNEFSFSSNRTWQKTEAKNRVAEVNLSPKSKSLNAVIKKMGESGKDDHLVGYRPINFFLSDFNLPYDSTDFKNLQESIFCVPIRTDESSNIYLDSVWFCNYERKIEGFDTVLFSVVNKGDKDLLNYPVILEINGSSQMTTLDLRAGSKTSGEFVYKVPEDMKVKGLVSIKNEVLPFDNKLYFSYILPEKIKVLVLSDSEELVQVINKLFLNDDNVVCNNISENELDYHLIDEYDIFIIGELSNISSTVKAWLINIHKTHGKQIVLIPTVDIDLLSYNSLGVSLNEFTVSEMDSVSLELLPVDVKHPFFAHVFKDEKLRSNIKMKMPELSNHYKIASSKGERLILKSDGSSYLTKSDKLTLFASGITDESSEFSKHPLVVPVFYKLVFSAVLSADLYVTYGKKNTFQSKSWWGEVYDFRSQDSLILNGRVNEISGIICVDDNFSQAGFYEVMSNDSVIDNLAVNYSRFESRANFPIKDLIQLAKEEDMVTVVEDEFSSSRAVKEELEGGSYWKLFLILAGTCLLVEMLLLRVVLSKKITV